jgi:hypothetical protein
MFRIPRIKGKALAKNGFIATAEEIPQRTAGRALEVIIIIM